MEPLPLPVDVVSTTLDTIVDWADIAAGLGTVGALLYAGMTFNKQLNDARRVQAAKVVVSYVSEQSRMSTTFVMGVKNYSDMPVFSVVRTTIPPKESGLPTTKHRPIYRLDPDEEPTIETPATGAGRPRAVVTFKDAAGRRWERDSDGELRSLDVPKWRRFFRSSTFCI